MNTAEYANLARVEREHWFYAGKREIVARWIDRCLVLTPQSTLLDFGAGTGLFAARFSGRCRVQVLDAYPESLAILRGRFPAADVLAPASDGGIPVRAGSVDCVTALDVLEHLDDDHGAVAELARVVRPGGIAVVTVPADMRLWSDWDVSLQHRRRYSRRELGALFAGGWAVERLAFINVAAYPAVWAVRRLARRAGRMRAEDRVPPPWLNRLLRWAFVFPAMNRWCPAPFGVGLLLVARRRAG